MIVLLREIHMSCEYNHMNLWKINIPKKLDSLN